MLEAQNSLGDWIPYDLPWARSGSSLFCLGEALESFLIRPKLELLTARTARFLPSKQTQ